MLFPYTKLCYSVSGAEDCTDFSRSYLYQAIKDGRLKTFRRGSRTYILDVELRRFIAAEAGISLDEYLRLSFGEHVELPAEKQQEVA